MNIVRYTEKHRESLNVFCAKCNEEGVANNSNYESIKMRELKGNRGAFWLCYDEDTIISAAGAQLIKFQNISAVRALYRAASLKSHRGACFSGLSRYHFNSIPFSRILPHCIEWKNKYHSTLDIMITTNINFKKYKTSNTDRLFHLLQKCGLVSHVGGVCLYNVWQNIWKLNEKVYLRKWQRFYENNISDEVFVNH